MALPVNEPALDELVLERLRFAIGRHVSAEFCPEIEPYVRRDDFGDDLMYGLRAHVMAEKVKEISHPATWWDAVKERFFHGWLLKRFPVCYTRHDVLALRPAIQYPRGQRPLMYVRTLEDMRHET